MTAPNHALGGALIGLLITNPWLAVPLAFLSHFVQDAIPHYDPPGNEQQRIGSRRFVRELSVQAVICVLIVLVIFLVKPKHWLLVAVCAFLATSPDLFWIPKFIAIKRTGKPPRHTNIFWRFHSAIQWKTAPKLIWVEAVWFVGIGSIVVAKL